MFGWTARQVVGRSVDELVPPDVSAVHAAHRESYVQNPKPRPMGAGLQLKVRHKSGELLPVDISLNEVSGTSYVIVAVRDVSDRIALDEERRQRTADARSRQTHALASLGELAGGIAHDFNNLVGVILNYVTLLDRQLEAEESRADLEQIRLAATRASALVRQLLTFARPDLGDKESLDLGDVIDELGEMLRRTVPATIDLVVDHGREQIWVRASERSIHQMLLNLAINARDAMPYGGQLTISLSSGWSAAGQHVAEISITDTGSGMSPEVRGRAFEPFFTTKQRGVGTGLGLSTVYGIANALGGSIEIDSTVGRGTVVTIQLPVADSDGAPVAGPERGDGLGTQSSAITGRLLLVEDEAALSESARRILVDHGVEVVVAIDGVEALEIFDATDDRFDVVVTDMVMPRMNGGELIDRTARSAT